MPADGSTEAEKKCQAPYSHDGAQPINTNCDSGAVYVYTRVGGGNFVEQQILQAPTPTCDEEVGTAVAVAGEMVFIASERHASLAGRVWVFERTGPGQSWELAQTLSSQAIGSFDAFGSSLSIEGDSLAVGATGAGADSRGLVVLFRRANGAWMEDVNLAPGAGLDYAFGRRVALSGNTLAVSATGSNAPFNVVYAFDRNGAGWTLHRTFLGTSSSTDAFNYWGSALGLEGDTLMVGEYGADDADPSDSSCLSGAVHVYRRTGPRITDWVLDTLLLNAPVCGDNVGFALDLDGDQLAVGAPSADSLGTGSSLTGAAVLFERAPLGSVSCSGSGCPCGNDDVEGGCASSTGNGGRLAATGSASIAADDLRLRATGLPPGRLALFVVGVPRAPSVLGDGLWCVGGPMTRYVRQMTNGYDGGTVVLDDVVAQSGGVVMAGALCNFQCLYRDDRPSPCGASLNSTHALSISFIP